MASRKRTDPLLIALFWIVAAIGTGAFWYWIGSLIFAS